MKKHIAEELPARQFKQADMDAKNEDGKGGKGQKDPEERVRQAVYDIRYRARREEIPLAQAYAQYMQNSNMGAPEKALVKAKLEGKEMKEEYGVDELASDSIANALYKVFVEKNQSTDIEEDNLLSFYREEVVKNSRGEAKYKVEVIGNDGRSYVRYATREKINDLRANPNIKSVEMTEYGEPYEGERKRGEETARVKAGKKDYDGDDKIESGSKEHAGVVHNAIQRRKGGVPDGQDTRKESVEFIDEVKKVKKKKKGDEKIDVMTGKNTVKVGPTDGQSITSGYENFGPVLTESGISSGQLKFSRMLQEKAVSQNQQQLAGMALAYLRGDMPDASDEVKKMAKMGEKKLRDFAKTKHEGLPEKVEEAKCETSDKNENGEDERGDYAKKNLIKNRIRAALGIKNPVIMTAGYEPEGENIQEIPLVPIAIGAGLAAGAYGLHKAGESMRQSKAGVTKPASGTIEANVRRNREQEAAVNRELGLHTNSFEPKGEIVSEEESDRESDRAREGGDWRSRSQRPIRRRPSVADDPRYGSVSDEDWARSPRNPRNQPRPRRRRY